MRLDDQQNESKEVTADIEKAKASTIWGDKVGQLKERLDKTREIEEAKKKGK